MHARCPTVRHQRRSGISLLEIIIALAVLTGTAAILAQMVGLAAKHAERSQQISQAQTIAYNILNELMADLRAWDSSEAFQPVDPWTPWNYQLRFAPVGFGNIVAVTVTVAEQRGEAPMGPEVVVSDQTQIDNPRQFQLTRWVIRDTESITSRNAPTQAEGHRLRQRLDESDE
jgi:Tfp pilus assembly protein PilV